MLGTAKWHIVPLSGSFNADPARARRPHLAGYHAAAGAPHQDAHQFIRQGQKTTLRDSAALAAIHPSAHLAGTRHPRAGVGYSA